MLFINVFFHNHFWICGAYRCHEIEACQATAQDGVVGKVGGRVEN